MEFHGISRVPRHSRSCAAQPCGGTATSIHGLPAERTFQFERLGFVLNRGGLDAGELVLRRRAIRALVVGLAHALDLNVELPEELLTCDANAG